MVTAQSLTEGVSGAQMGVGREQCVCVACCWMLLFGKKPTTLDKVNVLA